MYSDEDVINFLKVNNEYSDRIAKTNYLLNKHGFILHSSYQYLLKKDLVIPTTWAHLYSKEQLDMLNYLANQGFVNNIYDKCYENDIASIKYEDLHHNSLREIRSNYNEAKQDFLEHITIN